MRRKLSLIAVLLCISVILCGCNQTAAAPVDLMAGITPQNPEKKTVDYNFTSSQYDFTAALISETAKNESGNFILSPLSLGTALALVANGADTQTKSELMSLIGGGMDSDTYNAYMKAYTDSLGQEVLAANSIWYKNDSRLTVKKDFLQTNADYFGATAQKISFDNNAKDTVNNWVKEATQGNIDSIIEKIEQDSVMFLINALTFESFWNAPYHDSAVASGNFTTADNKKVSAQMMSSTEDEYIQYGGATGFIKPYAMANFLFVAVLPQEGTSIGDYMASLKGEDIKGLIDSAQQTQVRATMPKFSFEYSLKAGEALEKLGVKTAFDTEKADFSAMGKMEGANLYLKDVIHKSYITVDNQGTKAGAVSSAEIAAKTSLSPETKTVTLDRPFMFMILDINNNLPVFIGAVTDPTGE